MHRLFASATVALCLCLAAFCAEDRPADLIASTSLIAPAAASTYTLRTQVEEVRVTFHAFDHNRRPVLDLPSDSLIVLDNGSRVPAFATFQSAADIPLSVALMLDASDSVARDFVAEQQATSALIHNLLHSNDDRALLVSFREKIDLARPMTADSQELTSALREIKTGGLTSLYDALVATSRRLTDADPNASRRAIILLSDGDDTDSRYMLRDALAALVRNDVAVYTITVRDKHASARGQRVLEQLAEASGGRSYLLRRPQELGPVMQEIERDLRTQYLVTYRPPAGDSTFHSLKLTSTMKEISIRARAGYFVAPQH